MVEFKSEDAEYAWLAALIDTDGSISFRTGKAKRSDWNQVEPIAIVTNSNLLLLGEVKRHFGISGNIIINRPQDHNRFGKRPQCYIHFSGNKLREILPKIYPFLVVKQKQAAVAIGFLSIKKHYRRVQEAIGSERYRKIHSWFRETIMELNRPLVYRKS